MIVMWLEDAIRWGARVSSFLMVLSKTHSERWSRAQRSSGTVVPFPFGDIAYGEALAHWDQIGRPSRACFSYAEGQVEDPFLIEFRKELTAEFGLPVMTREEAKKWDTKWPLRVQSVRVTDFGLN